MLHGALSHSGTYVGLEKHAVWRETLAWLRTMSPDIALGEYELRGRDQYVSVQEYNTMSVEATRFESHQYFVDLQYTIRGAEAVDWLPRGELVADGPFANDVQFWQPPSGQLTRLVQSTGRFAIFYPEDAHRPKVAVPGFPSVRKLVIKTALSLIS